MADFVARHVIRVGGIGTIVAISTVFLFLSWVVWPLLEGEHLADPDSIPVALDAGEVLATGADDSFSVLWACTSDGRITTASVEDGKVLAEGALFERPPTSSSFPVRASRGIFGFDDGSVRFVSIEGRTEYRDAEDMEPAQRERAIGQRFLVDDKVAERISVDQFALRSVGWEAGEPIALVDGASIVAVDVSMTSTGPASASIDSRGVLRVTQVHTTKNLLTGKESIETESGVLPLEAVATRGLPRWVMLRGLGDNALAVWEDGHAVRVDVRDLGAPAVAEELDLLPHDMDRPGAPSAPFAPARLTALAFLNGKNTLLVGDSDGGVGAWFRVPAPAMTTGDGAHFILGHKMDAGPAPVTALASSPRTRVMAAGYADGTVRVFHVTSDRLLAESRMPGQQPVSALWVLPDDTRLLGWSGGLHSFELDAPHPEISWTALARPVHYEGYAEAEHVWQSSSGTDDFEPKFGLWPLVFGTLKATLYAMAFGVPIALMAAVYTSEFLSPQLKARIKPAIEMMASLPSVVLGFLAALVLAPLVEDTVPEVMASLIAVPFSLLFFAHLWQFLPAGRRSHLQTSRLSLAALAIAVGVAGAAWLGPALEVALFEGNLRRWLDGGIGRAEGGWLFLTLPLSAVAAGVAVSRLEGLVPAGRGSAPARSMVAFLGGSLAAVALAFGSAALLSAAGLDLRGPVLGTYVQRNALVVGFVMAFAIVPIIYTIAEDALSSIPETLRAGSLALGATPWQTALRIVVPTAMSGLFSAVMVGLGRAVGETMIVLMAAGNTPVLDWNIFNGFRTLSANIAVELPEAVRNGTHYRTLFLAAFTLFLITFVLNTVAELIRLRFRRRAQQL